MKKITEITRRDIFDLIKFGFVEVIDGNSFEQRITYFGRVDEISFLDRLYKLDEMPSFDSRRKNARGDIGQHTINNEDWDWDWVFSDSRFGLVNGDDEVLLDFICEMMHPVVRNDNEPWQKYLEKFNNLLKYDGYQLVEESHISGRPVYNWKEKNSSLKVIEEQISDIKISFDSSYVDTQVDLMYKMIETAPNSAIGKAKELIEICCKTILDEKGITYSTELDLIQLMRVACDSIGLSAKKLPEGTKEKEIASRILGNLVNISQGMAELRNLYGDGHGKNKNFKPLPSRYARLAVGACVTAVNFIWDTYLINKG